MTHDISTIAAYVDGELDDLAARRIEREAETDSALAAEIARHRTLKERLTAHFAPVLDESVPDRLRNLLVVDSKIDTSLAERREEKRARFSPIHWGALAASLVLGLTIGSQPWAPTANVASDNGRLVASGPLANALDTQLASNQTGDVAVRIGLSFRDKAGRYCRSFEGTELSGIGCRDQDRWSLEQTMQGRLSSEYRQASSGAMAAAVADMMLGDPFDAESERAARDQHWAVKK